MLRATLKSVWARKLRLIMSALSIVLGVAFVAGSLMFTSMLSSSFDSLVRGALADVNVSLETTGISGSRATPACLPSSSSTRTWPPSRRSTAWPASSRWSRTRRSTLLTATAECSPFPARPGWA